MGSTIGSRLLWIINEIKTRDLFLTSIFWVYDGTARYEMLGEAFESNKYAKMLLGELTRVGLPNSF